MINKLMPTFSAHYTYFACTLGYREVCSAFRTFKVVVPSAKSGILAGIVLGSGRAIGETMAIILVAGNSVQIPTSIFDKVRPLTSNIALEMGYATQSHQELLFATGVVLFAFILILNLVISKLSSKEGK